MINDVNSTAAAANPYINGLASTNDTQVTAQKSATSPDYSELFSTNAATKKQSPEALIQALLQVLVQVLQLVVSNMLNQQKQAGTDGAVKGAGDAAAQSGTTSTAADPTAAASGATDLKTTDAAGIDATTANDLNSAVQPQKKKKKGLFGKIKGFFSKVTKGAKGLVGLAEKALKLFTNPKSILGFFGL